MSEETKSVTLDELESKVAESEQEEKKEQEEEAAKQEMSEAIFDPNAPIITIRKLLEAGVHYGHQTRKWNPKMKQYIYCARNGIYIIDLTKTKTAVEGAYAKLKEIVLEGGKVLIVGTKDNVKEVVKEEAERSGSFYVTSRWLGGTLTNFKTIQTRIKRLKELEEAETDGEWEKLPKKTAIGLRKEKEKLAKNLDGIKEMRKVPNALIVVDPTDEKIAVLEAKKLNIPVFAFCDTNCDPDNIDYVIPGNDDLDKSVKLLVSVLCDAVVEAKGGLPEIAYTKDEADEANMQDVLRSADRENALRQAAKKEMQRERLERERARYNARFGQKDGVKTPAKEETAEKKNEATEEKGEE